MNLLDKIENRPEYLEELRLFALAFWREYYDNYEEIEKNPDYARFEKMLDKGIFTKNEWDIIHHAWRYRDFYDENGNEINNDENRD